MSASAVAAAAAAPFRGPLKVAYCPVCSMPPEYCEFGPSWDRCKVELAKSHPDLLAQALAKMSVSAGAASAAAASSAAEAAPKPKKAKSASDDEDEDDDEEDDEEDAPKKPAAGGDDDEFLAAAAPVKAAPVKKAAAAAVPGIFLSLSQRSKKKFVTSARGWESFGLVLKDVSKLLSKKFATAASVVKCEGAAGALGQMEIAMQGDLMQDLPYWIVEEFEGKIDEKQVWVVDKAGKKSKAF